MGKQAWAKEQTVSEDLKYLKVPNFIHFFTGSILLPVPVPVLELIQVFWRFRVGF